MEIQEIIVAVVSILALLYLIKRTFLKDEDSDDPCSSCSSETRKIPGHIKAKQKGE